MAWAEGRQDADNGAMNEPTLLVLGPDGKIVRADGPASAHWQGKLVAQAVGLPDEVLVAADELLDQARTSASWINRRFVTSQRQTYELAWGVATLVGSALRHLSQKTSQRGIVSVSALPRQQGGGRGHRSRQRTGHKARRSGAG